MKNILDISEIFIATVLIVFILLQKQSGGVSALFGGGSGEEYHTKRGFEKFLFGGTIVLATIFVVLAIIRLVL